MSKKSCEAAESAESAILRMARVNCNFCEWRGVNSNYLSSHFTKNVL